MTRAQRFIILALTLGICANLPACAPDREAEPDQLSALLSGDDFSRFEDGIAALMDSGAVTGPSIAIATDSAIVWSKGFGLRSLQAGEPVDTTTVFEAASLSKPVFAYAFLQLVDQGLFDLDTPITDYYRYESIAHEARSTQITPRHVLTHSTGFPTGALGEGNSRSTSNPEPSSVTRAKD